MQVNSLFEQNCRYAVLQTLKNGIPVRNRMHKNTGLPTEVFYAFDCKVNNKSKGRCDIVLWLEYPKFKQTICIECKSGMRDLKSGYGLNFDSEINYIIYPKMASKFISDWSWNFDEDKITKYLWEKKLTGIGILELDENNKIRLVKRAYNKDDQEFAHLGLGTEFGDY